MTNIINQYSEQIWNIYNENFPSYLKQPKKKFITSIYKYNFFDIMFHNYDNKYHLNNLPNRQHNISGLNKDLTYSNRFFSNIFNIAGFALFNYFPKYKILHLDYISLAKVCQGKGNGSYYLKYLINNLYLKNQPMFSYLILECEDHLLKFYKSNGFVKINFNYTYKGNKMNLMVYGDVNIKKYQLNIIALYLQNIFNKYVHLIFILTKQIFQFTLNYSYLINLKYRFHVVDNYQKS